MHCVLHFSLQGKLVLFEHRLHLFVTMLPNHMSIDTIVLIIIISFTGLIMEVFLSLI